MTLELPGSSGSKQDAPDLEAAHCANCPHPEFVFSDMGYMTFKSQ